MGITFKYLIREGVLAAAAAVGIVGIGVEWSDPPLQGAAFRVKTVEGIL